MRKSLERFHSYLSAVASDRCQNVTLTTTTINDVLLFSYFFFSLFCLRDLFSRLCDTSLLILRPFSAADCHSKWKTEHTHKSTERKPKNKTRNYVNHSIWFVHRKCASLISKTSNIFSIISYKTKCHTKSKRVRAFKRAEQKIELIKNALNEKLSMRSGKKGSEISWQVGNKWAATTKKCVNGNQKWLWEDETNEERKETVCKMCGKAIDDFFPSHYGNIVSHCTLMPADEKFVVVVFSLGRYLCL